MGSNLWNLHQTIHQRTYQSSPTKAFVVCDPKPREIFAAPFFDRVIHHLVVYEVERFWEKRFAPQSFACRKGKGQEGALKFFKAKVNQVSKGGRKEVFCLQLDIQSYFITIDRQILWKIWSDFFSSISLTDSMGFHLPPTPSPHSTAAPTHPIQSEALWLEKKKETLSFLMQKIICDDPRKKAYLIPSPHWKLIPSYKSWFSMEPQQGIPIGNLTSQLSANVYLNDLDHWIMKELKPSAYFRYMDDLTLLDTNAEKLNSMTEKVNNWLRVNRNQQLNPKKTLLNSIYKGTEYLGHLVLQTKKPGAENLFLLPTEKKKEKLIHDLNQFKKEITNLDPNIHAFRAHSLSPILWSRLVKRLGSINSRLGWMASTQCFYFRRKTIHYFLENNKWKKIKPTGLCPVEYPHGPLKIGNHYKKIIIHRNVLRRKIRRKGKWGLKS